MAQPKRHKWIKPTTPKPLQTIVDHEADKIGKEETLQLTIPNIPGINTQAGLKRMGGNKKGYLKLLAKFRSNQGETDKYIITALKEQDMHSAELHAHTLKGVAATIGAVELEEKARNLESAIKDRSSLEQIDLLLKPTAKELAIICETLDKILPKEDKQSKKKTVTKESPEMIARRNELLEKATEQLLIYDAGVENTMEMLRDGPVSQELLDWIEKIEEKVSQYDFDGAAQILEQCKDAIN
jgi:HPt (histidine-containing phosphotransfer) domain-containing protein